MRAGLHDPAGALPLHPARGPAAPGPGNFGSAFGGEGPSGSLHRLDGPSPPNAENDRGSRGRSPLGGIQGQSPWWGRGAKPLAVLLLATLALTACGRKGPPVPPGPPDQVIYPRSYPAR